MTSPYADDYKKRYDAYFEAKRLAQEKEKAERLLIEKKERIEKTKQKTQLRKNPDSILKEVREKVKSFEVEVEKDSEIAWDYITEPRHIKILKILVILIALGIIGYLVYSNFIASQDFNYFYDIGSQEDIKKPYLTPLNRISEIDAVSGTRNLISNLVYFGIEIPRGSKLVVIGAKVKDNFPENSIMSIGAKDQEVWHYKYNSVYNPSLNNLSEFPKKDNVYLINPNLYLLTPEKLKYERNIIVATDRLYAPLPNIITDYKQEDAIINTSLRGAHTFYIYASGDLSLEIKKQDINWYEGSDELEISLYDLENNLIANATIEDDGVVEVKNKETAKIQDGILQADNLREGVYKLEFGNFDGLIREIKINTNKIVADEKIFLADNSVYNVETKNSLIYTESTKNSELKLLTYHAAGIQNLTYNDGLKNKTFNFYQEDAPLYLNLTKGEYTLTFPKNDIIVSGAGYFAFSKENYFEPFKQKVVKIQNDMEWIKNNVDYLVTEYKSPVKNNGWLIAETEFNLERDGLFVKDNKLSMVFNIPHLSQETTQNYTIPIDWIKITVHKPGLFEKLGRTR